MGDPYVQLLSLVNITGAAAEFQQVRGGTVNIQNANGSPSPSPSPSSSVSTESSPDQLGKLVSMVPILFVVAGTNGLILLVLLVGAVWFCCFRGRNKKAKKVAPLPLAMVDAAVHNYEAVAITEDVQERPSSARSPQLTRTISRQSQRSFITDVNELPHSPMKAQSDTASSRSRYSSLKPRVSDGDASKGPQITSSSSIKSGFVGANNQLVDAAEPVHHTKDITDGANRPFRPVPPPPITVPSYRRSVYSENAASPTIAGSVQGIQLYDAPIRSSVVASSSNPSPIASQYEGARGSMYSVTTPPEAGVSNVSVTPATTQHPLLSPHMQPQTLSRQQEAQRAAFMAALDSEPLPPPRRPRGFGSGGLVEDPRQRLSAYSAAPVVSQDLGLPAHANRHSYAAPIRPPGVSAPQRSSYIPESGPQMKKPSPFNPSSGNGDGTN